MAENNQNEWVSRVWTPFEGMTRDNLIQQVNNLQEQIKELESDLKKKPKSISDLYWEDVSNAIVKPAQFQTEWDKQLLGMNPELKKLANNIDEKQKALELLKEQKINLENAWAQMFWSLEKAREAINQWADSAKRGVARQEATQQGALSGMAGNLWATSGMLAKGTAQISNQFAGQKDQIDAQRQQQLWQVAQQEVAIPAQLSGIQAQNVSNELNQRRMDIAEKEASNSLSTPSSGTWTDLETILKRLAQKQQSQSQQQTEVDETNEAILNK